MNLRLAPSRAQWSTRVKRLHKSCYPRNRLCKTVISYVTGTDVQFEPLLAVRFGFGFDPGTLLRTRANPELPEPNLNRGYISRSGDQAFEARFGVRSIPPNPNQTSVSLSNIRSHVIPSNHISASPFHSAPVFWSAGGSKVICVSLSVRLGTHVYKRMLEGFRGRFGTDTETKEEIGVSHS